MPDWYPAAFSEPEERRTTLRITGVGAGGAVTKVFGAGLHITYVAAGRVLLTWSANDDRPGQPIGPVGEVFQATTPANVKGYSLTAGAYDATARTMEIQLWDSANAAVDLKATEFVNFEMIFKVYKA